jgi:hypothetical protein
MPDENVMGAPASETNTLETDTRKIETDAATQRLIPIERSPPVAVYY